MASSSGTYDEQRAVKRLKEMKEAIQVSLLGTAELVMNRIRVVNQRAAADAEPFRDPTTGRLPPTYVSQQKNLQAFLDANEEVFEDYKRAARRRIDARNLNTLESDMEKIFKSYMGHAEALHADVLKWKDDHRDAFNSAREPPTLDIAHDENPPALIERDVRFVVRGQNDPTAIPDAPVGDKRLRDEDPRDDDEEDDRHVRPRMAGQGGSYGMSPANLRLAGWTHSVVR